MKKILLTITLALASFGAFAQGTVNFDNSPLSTGGAVDAKIYLGAVGGTLLADTGNFAQIYYLNGGSEYVAVGPISTFYPTGSGGEEYVNPSGVSVALPGVALGGSATVQVRAWTGAATWELAQVRGESSPVNIAATGGAGAPPGLPANLVGLQSFAITPVPEPTTIAFGILGAGSLLFLRRKK
jgi:hypothetical protein